MMIHLLAGTYELFRDRFTAPWKRIDEAGKGAVPLPRGPHGSLGKGKEEG